MSDNYTDDTIEGDEGNEDFKNLRAKARKADTLERENAQMKRELAFTKAGIPMEDPKLGYFLKGYDGDLEPEQIRQAAVEAGFIPAPEQPADPAVDQAREGQARVMAASSGTTAEFDEAAVGYAMEQAYKEGGIPALSNVARQYGVTIEHQSL
jgi:hypothetical protein